MVNPHVELLYCDTSNVYLWPKLDLLLIPHLQTDKFFLLFFICPCGTERCALCILRTSTQKVLWQQTVITVKALGQNVQRTKNEWSLSGLSDWIDSHIFLTLSQWASLKRIIKSMVICIWGAKSLHAMLLHLSSGVQLIWVPWKWQLDGNILQWLEEVVIFSSTDSSQINLHE